MKKKIYIIITLTVLTALSFGMTSSTKDVPIDIHFLKYGTVYAAGDISNSIEAAEPTYFLRTNQDGSIYSIPDVVDNTSLPL